LLEYADFVARLKELKARGWVKTHRSGPTGIGKTIEDLLGVKENNVAGPDGNMVELKSARKGQRSMLTLFTKSPDSKGANSILLDRFGYLSYPQSPTKELHTTLNAVDYNTLRGRDGLKVAIRPDRIEVVSRRNGAEAAQCSWSREVLRKAFERKLPRLLYIKAQHRGRGAAEEFWFDEAHLLQGFGFENFGEQLRQGKILVDIRIGQWPPGHPHAGQPHDHGTGFRVFPDNLEFCFASRQRVV
jgi:hypothetical protein